MNVTQGQVDLPCPVRGLEKAFRTTIVLTITTALLGLSLALASPIYMGLTVIACFLSWRQTEMRQRWVLKQSMAIRLMLLAVALGVGLKASGVARLLPAAIHTLFWLQVIKLFQQKRTRDYWQLLILSTVGMAATFMTSAHLFLAATLVLYAVTLCWALILLHLRSELARTQSSSFARSASPDADADQKKPPRLMSPGLLLVINLIIASSIFFDVAFFVLCPRLNKALLSSGPFSFAELSTGFSPRVTLGEVGEVQTSSEPVMHVAVSDTEEPGKHLQGDFYWRGAGLSYYNGKEWTTTSPRATEEEKGIRRRPVFPGSRSQELQFLRFKYGRLRQHDILREPINSRYLFCQPGCGAITSSVLDELLFHPFDSAFSLAKVPEQVIHYRAYSVPQDLIPRSFKKPVDTYSASAVRNFLQLPTGKTSPRVFALAKQICPDNLNLNPLEKAERVENYLNLNYAYTLKLQANPGVEPVEDFLFNQHSGHCEYFASAMVVLLRTLGVPSRLVTGYHEGKYNAIGGWYLVRQSDAHAWVEVYVRPRVWKRYDPSPLLETDVGEDKFEDLLDFLATSWFSNVVQYDRHKQVKVYSLIRRGVKQAAASVELAVRASRKLLFTALVYLADPHSLLSVRGLAAFGSLIALVALISWLACRLTRKILTKISRQKSGKGGFAYYPSPVKFYRRLVRLLARQGYIRLPGQTPMEFAGLVRHHGGALYEMVPTITHYYYAVRFGDAQLSPAQVREVAETLKTLAARRNHRNSRR